MFWQKIEPVITLSNEELARCRELSYGDEGYMCEDLDYALAHEKHKRMYRYTYANLISESEGGRIIGWSLIKPIYRSPRYEVQLFVDPVHRRRGIGKALLMQANYFCQWKHRPVCYVDDENEGFFASNPSLFTEV